MNVSKQNYTKTNLTAIDDDGNSMYLSFESDNESAITASYKTIAGDGETSCLSDLMDSQDSKGNSTLEPQKTELSGIMKDCAIDTTSTDISALNLKKATKNFKGFNALSSTPSKIASPSPLKLKFEQNQKTKQLNSVGKIIRPDLSAVFNNLVAEFEQETKENLLPSDDSMPSFSKASIMKLQNEKNLTPKTVAKTELQFQMSSDKKVINNIREANASINSPKKEFGRCQADIVKTLKVLNEKLMPLSQVLENKVEEKIVLPKKETPRIQAGVEKTLAIISENTEPTHSKMTTQSKVKMNSAVRKTMCEPNLQNNRPSRIVTGKRGRASLAGPISQGLNQRNLKSGSGSISEEGSDIQMAQNNDKPKTEKLVVKSPEGGKPKSATVMRKKAINSGRKSMAANLQNETKRPTPKRMPAVMKTTFNCATRKASRPSLSGSNNALPKRRSILLLQSKVFQSPMTKRKKYQQSESTSSNDGMNVRIAGGGDLRSNSPHKRNASAATAAANTRKSVFIEKPENVKFACTECGASYHVKALLESHKKTHRAASPDVSKKMQRATGGAIGNTVVGGGTSTLNAMPNHHQCKYCDKVFTLERTLHIHLLEHCPKIPAAERRKLDFTELEHVPKEETPHFRVPPQVRPIRKTLISALNVKDPLGNFPIGTRFTAGGPDKRYDDEESKKVERTNSPNSRYTVNKQTVMAPPVQKFTKPKKNAAHTGVYRTPNKDIPCGLQGCKQSFKNVLDFTNHMLAHTTLDECLSSLNGPAHY